MEYKALTEQTSRYRRTVKIYARMLLKGKIDWQQLKNIYNRKIAPEYAEYRIKRLLRSQESQRLIEKEIIELYSAQDITPETIIREEKDLYQAAKIGRAFPTSDKILERWGKRIGMDPTQKKIIQKTTAQPLDYKTFLTGRHQPPELQEHIEVKGDKPVNITSDSPGNSDSLTDAAKNRLDSEIIE